MKIEKSQEIQGVTDPVLKNLNQTVTYLKDLSQAFPQKDHDRK